MSELTYDDWNEAVGRYCFHPGNAGHRVRFAIDPIVLQRAAAQGARRHHFISPEAAADDFRAVVTNRIDRFGWDFGRPMAGRTPSGLAKLALQVLAVFGIAADDVGGSSYWAALLETLGREVDRRGVKPDDLDLELHQQNWAQLVHWTNVLNKGRVGILPEPDPHRGGRRHVRLPLSHGLLRLEDIQGLHRFFDRIRLAPGDDVEPEELISDLRSYGDDPSVFRGAHARRVLQDERLSLAAVQIANAAAQWDGRRVDLAGSRREVYRLWLSVTMRDGARVVGGLVQIDARGAQRDVPGVDLPVLFGQGAIRRLSSPVPYRPIHDTLVLAVRSLLDRRYIESRHFRPGDPILLARRGQADDRAFTRQLRGIASAEQVDIIRPDPPHPLIGWILYRIRVREDVKESELPRTLVGRLRLTGPRLRVSGGLRVRGAWMEGAGPTLAVSDGEAETVIVDGVEYATVEGRLQPEHCPALGRIGLHEAWLPGHHRDHVRFRVRRPRQASFGSPVVGSGWGWRESPDWPAPLRDGVETAGGRMRGPAVEGDWPPARSPEPAYGPAAQVALRLATALRYPKSAGGIRGLSALKAANTSHPNLLVRQLAQALPAIGDEYKRLP